MNERQVGSANGLGVDHREAQVSSLHPGLGLERQSGGSRRELERLPDLGSPDARNAEHHLVVVGIEDETVDTRFRAPVDHLALAPGNHIGEAHAPVRVEDDQVQAPWVEALLEARAVGMAGNATVVGDAGCQWSEGPPARPDDAAVLREAITGRACPMDVLTC